MSATGFRAADAGFGLSTPTFRLRRGWAGRWVDAGLLLFCLLMVWLMYVDNEQATIPYHLLFLSITLVYGFRIWPLLPTLLVLLLVTATTGALLYGHYRSGIVDAPELAEVPLMPALVVAMVWHARRRVAAQDALQEMADHQREMFDRERSFFRNTAHAIRTPVTIARGHLELAEPVIVVPQVHEDVRVAMRQLERMALLSNRLLALAQLDSGESPPVLPIRLQGFVQEMGVNWTAAAGRCWSFDCPDDAAFLADPAWLGLAVDALVENAVHFTAEGGRIAVTGRVCPHYCTISVCDDGPGIAPEDLEHVFERFWHRRPPNGPMGSGLGLAMTLATANACRGGVDVRNNDDGGATFVLRLPRHRPTLRRLP